MDKLRGTPPDHTEGLPEPASGEAVPAAGDEAVVVGAGMDGPGVEGAALGAAADGSVPPGALRPGSGLRGVRNSVMMLVAQLA